MSQRLSEAVYARATGDAGVAALVGARVYPGLLPQDVTWPATTQQLISDVAESAMGSDAGVRHARVQLTAWAESYEGAAALRDALFAAFERWRGTAAGVTVQDTFVSEQPEFYDDTLAVYAAPLDAIVHYEG